MAGLRPRIGRGLARGGGTGQIHAGRPDLAVEQPAAGLSGAATVSSGGGSGVEALAAAEETTRSVPGSGGTAAGGNVWWRGWRGRRGDGGGERPEVWRSWRRVRGDGGAGYHDKPSSSCAIGAR
uniref:DUF834 domain-containing protein n=1 Tax=Oryza barthii TaxID=65489 RepID=A0A0D3GGC6_9ORYZ